LAYLAPEVRDGTDRVDGRVDLYSAGIVLFELLTGQRPAGRELPSDLVAGLPSWCDRVFARLYTRVESRLPDVPAVLRAMKADGRVRVTPLTPPDRRLVSEHETRRRLGLTPRELQHWVRRGALECYSVRGQRRFDREQVEHFGRQRPIRAGRGDDERKGVDELPSPPGSAGRSSRATSGPPAPRSDRSPGRVRTTPSPGLDATSTRRPAGLLLRGVAMLLDLWAIAIVDSMISIPMFWFPLALIPSFFVVFLVYFSVGTGVFGRTLGKGALGLRVVRSDGSPVRGIDGVVRTLNYVASLIPLGLGFLYAGFDSQKRALHDLICGTRVVREREIGTSVTARGSSGSPLRA
ncbi:MAG: RDD family protein, partial [Planctomycetes bacterium]|nr:RDD family protein [Planctomycetota bacterium]